MHGLKQLADPVRAVWEDALELDRAESLGSNLVLELAEYLDMPYSQVQHLCRAGAELMEGMWQSADPSTSEQVLKFYQEVNYYLFELTWWHSLSEDRCFLDSAICMKYAMQKGLRTFLDFGCGIGSHSIMMARHGFDVALFDVSERLVDYAKWRMSRRGHKCKAFVGDENWKSERSYDFILALDVMEHVASPRKTLAKLADMLEVNGILCVGIPFVPIPDRPMHFDYYRRDLLKDVKGLGLRHVKSLVYVDVFTKRGSSPAGIRQRGPASTGHRWMDRLVESALCLFHLELPRFLTSALGLVGRTLMAVGQTWHWYSTGAKSEGAKAL